MTLILLDNSFHLIFKCGSWNVAFCAKRWSGSNSTTSTRLEESYKYDVANIKEMRNNKEKYWFPIYKWHKKEKIIKCWNAMKQVATRAKIFVLMRFNEILMWSILYCVPEICKPSKFQWYTHRCSKDKIKIWI